MAETKIFHARDNISPQSLELRELALLEFIPESLHVRKVTAREVILLHNRPKLVRQILNKLLLLLLLPHHRRHLRPKVAYEVPKYPRLPDAFNELVNFTNGGLLREHAEVVHEVVLLGFEEIFVLKGGGSANNKKIS